MHLSRLLQVAGQAGTVENIVAENHGAGFAVDEFFTKNKGLSQAIRRRLYLVAQVDTIMRAVAEKAFKVGQIRRRRNNQISRIRPNINVDKG